MYFNHFVACHVTGDDIPTVNDIKTVGDHIHIMTNNHESVVPVDKINPYRELVASLLLENPGKPRALRRVAISVSALSGETYEVVKVFMESLAPYGFHFDIFCRLTGDPSTFSYLPSNISSTLHLHKIHEGFDRTYTYSKINDNFEGYGFYDYLNNYKPLFVIGFDLENTETIGYFSKAVNPDIRFISYILSDSIGKSEPSQYLFANDEQLKRLEYLTANENIFAIVENDNSKAMIKNLISSPGRIFTLPLTTSDNVTKIGDVDGKHGVVVLPNEDNTVSTDMVEWLSAIGLPSTFVYTKDYDVSREEVIEKFEMSLASNYNVIGPLPDNIIKCVIKSARVTVVTNTEQYDRIRDIDDTVSIISCGDVRYNDGDDNYHKLTNIDDFDSVCETIESIYGEVATIYSTRTKHSPKYALEFWFHWIYGKDGLAMFEFESK